MSESQDTAVNVEEVPSVAVDESAVNESVESAMEAEAVPGESEPAEPGISDPQPAKPESTEAEPVESVPVMADEPKVDEEEKTDVVAMEDEQADVLITEEEKTNVVAKDDDEEEVKEETVEEVAASVAASEPEKPVYSSPKATTEPPPRSRFSAEILAAIDSLDNEALDEIDSPKVLVEGLKPEVTESKLKEYFSKFGEVRLVKVNGDSGFGYVFFNDNSNIIKAVEHPEQEVESITVKVHQVLPSDSEKMKTNKLFVGGLPNTLTEVHLRQYFEKYGKIDHFQFVVNKSTQVRKAFCFITFEDAESVDKITESKIPPNSVVHTVNGMTIDCKKKFDEDHPVQKKIKARSSYNTNNRYQNQGGYGSTSYGNQGHYAAPGYYGSYGYPTGYEQYYAQYGYGYGYPGYGYPGYGYPGYGYPQSYSGYGPMKNQQNRSNYKPY